LVSGSFVLAGDVGVYGTSEVGSFAATIASGAGVLPSDVTVTISAASVRVDATINVPSEAAADTAKSSLASGILQSAQTLSTALASNGVEGATVLSTPTVTTSASCANPCAGATCAQGRSLPCSFTERMGCACEGCCDATSTLPPPDYCGAGLQWDASSRKCEVACAAD